MRQKALIDINMILDTRLGVLSRLNPTAANTIVRSKWYPIRDTDDFESVSKGVIRQDDFNRLMAENSTETLLNSIFTDFIYILRSDITEVFPGMEIMGLGSKIEFCINTYPYKLKNIEMEIIRRAVARYLTSPGEVSVVSLDYALLDPNTLSLNYDMLAIYNYEQWLKHHLDALKDSPIQSFTVFTPRVAPSNIVPEPDDVVKDPFMAVPMVLSEVITINPVPTSWVCWNPDVYDKLLTTSSNRQGSEAAPPESAPMD